LIFLNGQYAAIEDNLSNSISYESLSVEQRKIVTVALSRANFTEKYNFNLTNAVDNHLEKIEAEPERLNEAMKEGFDSPDRIFYHTIKRLKLAAANNDVISAQVGAEVGTQEKDGSKSSIVLDQLEFMNLIQASGAEDLHFIMLVESIEGFDNLEEELVEAFNDSDFYSKFVDSNLNRLRRTNQPLYELVQNTEIHTGFTVLDAMKSLNPRGDNFKSMLATIDNAIVKESLESGGRNFNMQDILHLQVMSAQSDYTRRGTFSSKEKAGRQRGSTAETLSSMFGIKLQNYRGGSKHGDTYRAADDMAKKIDRTFTSAADLQKDTTQGSDAIEAFTNPSTYAHRTIMMLSAVVHRLTPDVNFIKRNFEISEADSKGKIDKKYLEYQNKYFRNNDQKLSKRYFFQNGDALDKLNSKIVKEYHDYTFNKASAFSYYVAQESGLAYHENVNSGNAGSRAGSKGGTKKDERFLDAVSGTRTIGLSEAVTQSLLGFRMQGAIAFEGGMKQYIEDLKSSMDSNPSKATRDAYLELLNKPYAAQVNAIYENAPNVAANIDAFGYDAAYSDMDYLWKRAIDGKPFEFGSKFEYTEDIKERPSVEEMKKLASDFRENMSAAKAKTESGYGIKEGDKNYVKVLSEHLWKELEGTQVMAGYLAHQEETTRAAAKLFIEAKTGKEVQDFDKLETKDLRQMNFDLHTSQVKAEIISKI